MKFDNLINSFLKEEISDREDRIKALKKLTPIEPPNRFKGLSWEEVEGTVAEDYLYERVLDGYDYDGEPLRRTAFIFKLITEGQEEVYGHVVFRGDIESIDKGWDTESITELNYGKYQELVDEVLQRF